jgi:hypothetical protein
MPQSGGASNKNFIHSGGGEKVIPMYREPINTSSLPNEQKQIFQEKIAEKGQKPPLQPTINFQYYQPPPKPREQPKSIDPNMFMPIYPQSLAYPPQWSYYGGAQIALPPIIKNIQINTDGPSGNHERLFIVNEDVMPTKPVIPSLTTIGERLTVYQFVRSSIFNNTDGTDIGLSGKSQNSLLSFIKFGELNPYNTYKFSDNPYKGLPDDFLIYSTCYPIRHQESYGGVSCAKDSTSVNVRIYKLTEGSFLINRLNPALYFEFDEWRDVAYYEFLRENITKRKVCPHFVTLFGYFISEKTGIDFAKIALIKNNVDHKVDDAQYNIRPEEENECVTREAINGGKIVKMSDMKIEYLNNNKQILEINPNAYLGKTLVLLTESPTYNILGWASKTYQSRGNIKEMINRGVHTEKEWMNILFQIMISMCVMQINKIFIKNFKLENNVYVKDLTLRGQITNYWKYKVNDIDFYLPNLGYLVLIDTNYRDLTESSTLSFNKPITNTHKIDGKFLGNDCKLTDQEINDNVFEMFKKAFDVNEFGKDFTNTGGCRPPAEILNLMGKIYADIINDKQKDIKKHVINYMRLFMHNRIGTYLKESEVSNIRRDDVRDFKKGQIVVLEDGYGTYKFVMFMETLNGKTTILTKSEPSDNDIVEMVVPVSSLLNYSKAEQIMQTFKPNDANMNEEDLLETYIIRE